jgi:hypothetical protein
LRCTTPIFLVAGLGVARLVVLFVQFRREEAAARTPAITSGSREMDAALRIAVRQLMLEERASLLPVRVQQTKAEEKAAALREQLDLPSETRVEVEEEVKV